MIKHRMTKSGPKTGKGNTWFIGSVVQVGFLKLKVLSVRSEKDGLPDIYTLESLDGTKKYEFIPHNGLHKIND